MGNEAVKDGSEGKSKALAAAAILALTAASYGLEFWREGMFGGEACPYLCAGTGLIAGALPCPLHGGGLTSG